MKYVVSIYMWIVSIVFLTLFFSLSLLFSVFVPFERLEKAMKASIRFCTKILFIRVVTENFDKLDLSKPYVFMPNHVSFYDSFILYGYLPHKIRGIEVESHFRWPIYGYYIKKFGNIPIDPKSLKTSLRSIREGEKQLKTGKSIIIFPEGQRTRDGEIANFKRLPFLLAIEAGSDIVPIGLSGFHKLMAAGSWLMQPAKVKIKIGDIITTEIIKDTNARELCKMTYEKVVALREKP